MECHWPGISNLMSVKAADIGINIKQLGARNGIRVRSRESGVGPWLPGCPVTRAMCTRVASADRKLRARRSADFPRIPHREPPWGDGHVPPPSCTYMGGMPTAANRSVGRSISLCDLLANGCWQHVPALPLLAASEIVGLAPCHSSSFAICHLIRIRRNIHVIEFISPPVGGILSIRQPSCG